ncbi:MAG: TRAP transporter small permease, partial [Tistlia sp.]
MLAKPLAAVDALSTLLLRISLLLLAALVAVNAVEVVARYLLSEPTIWAYDLATLLNGALFMLGLAYTLRVGGHVRIDVFAARLPARLQRGLVAGFLLLFLLPCLGLMASVAVEQA